MKNSLKGIKEIYENNLLSFGKNYKGVGWKKKRMPSLGIELCQKLF